MLSAFSVWPTSSLLCCHIYIYISHISLWTYLIYLYIYTNFTFRACGCSVTLHYRSFLQKRPIKETICNPQAQSSVLRAMHQTRRWRSAYCIVTYTYTSLICVYTYISNICTYKPISRYAPFQCDLQAQSRVQRMRHRTQRWRCALFHRHTCIYISHLCIYTYLIYLYIYADFTLNAFSLWPTSSLLCCHIYIYISHITLWIYLIYLHMYTNFTFRACGCSVTHYRSFLQKRPIKETISCKKRHPRSAALLAQSSVLDVRHLTQRWRCTLLYRHVYIYISHICVYIYLEYLYIYANFTMNVFSEWPSSSAKTAALLGCLYLQDIVPFIGLFCKKDL